MSKEDFIELKGVVVEIISAVNKMFKIRSQLSTPESQNNNRREIFLSATLSKKIPPRRHNLNVGDKVWVRVSILDVKKGIITGFPLRDR